MATPKRSSWERACEELEARLSREDPAQAADLAALDRVRVGLLGRKGALTELLKALKDLSLEDRRALGPRAQGLKTLLEGKIAERQNALERTADE
ncbi:MAG: phenylalanine--tRNA ligase subunit alpha, partial [Elusimicrobia bacterium]|nr:phenylalanine--tRNA ligase subunit alpha [Elusimicrobiota bacterium]